MEQLRSISEIQKTGLEAVKRLRKQKLSKGDPFMINSKKLPKGQCYLEYPDGSIKLASISITKRDFTILKELHLLSELPSGSNIICQFKGRVAYNNRLKRSGKV